jgi:sterol desaturase/sphingolipid hydroxylase (fatty acid hydroxylase superfamily)
VADVHAFSLADRHSPGARNLRDLRLDPGAWSIQRWTSLPAWPDGPPLASAATLASWIVVFLLVDLCYYWSHRLSHEVNILWAGHVVHHSSEEYNLTVALRQSSLHGLFTWVFYAPLALLGVPWLMFAVCRN